LKALGTVSVMVWSATQCISANEVLGSCDMAMLWVEDTRTSTMLFDEEIHENVLAVLVSIDVFSNRRNAPVLIHPKVFAVKESRSSKYQAVSIIARYVSHTWRVNTVRSLIRPDETPGILLPHSECMLQIFFRKQDIVIYTKYS